MLISAIYLDKNDIYKCKFNLEFNKPKNLVDSDILSIYNLGEYNKLEEIPLEYLGNGILPSDYVDKFINNFDNIHL